MLPISTRPHRHSLARRSLSLGLLLVALPLALHAQGARSVAVLSFQPVGTDTMLTQTVTSLVRAELARIAGFRVVESARTQSSCQDIECAVAAAREAGAELVVYGALSKLGSKYILSYSLGDVATAKRTRSGERTAYGAEELDQAAKGAVADIGGRTEGDAVSTSVAPTRVLNRRYDTISIGVGIGQLYPLAGYDDTERAFALDARLSLEKRDYSLDLLVALRSGLLLNFGASYIFIDGPVTPYVGGGLGYHAAIVTVFDNGYYTDEVYAGSFQAMARVGVWLMRTSAFRFFINADYMYNFEGDNLRAATVTLGVAGTTDQIRLF